jgi:hypothetical protein
MAPPWSGNENLMLWCAWPRDLLFLPVAMPNSSAPDRRHIIKYTARDDFFQSTLQQSVFWWKTPANFAHVYDRATRCSRIKDYIPSARPC